MIQNGAAYNEIGTTSGGNLSILDPDGSIWITPSRVDKGELQPADIVWVQADGTRIGRHAPSSEFPFHREIYRRRPDLGAIVHAHPGALVAFSICRLLPDTRDQLGRNIAETFARGADCVMLENHGVVIGGRDLQDAFQRFETLEFVAQTLVKAATLGEIQPLAAEEVVFDQFQVSVERQGLMIDVALLRIRADHQARHAQAVAV